MDQSNPPLPATAAAAEKPRLVVGLGNPGDRYRDTRHNVGFLVVERLARRLGAALDGESCGSRVATVQRGGAPVFLAQPQTFMNRSGHAVRCFVEAGELPLANLLVVYDDLHLPLGRLRLRPGGSPAGHRGLESILEQLTSDRVARLRLGIGDGAARPPQGDALVDFVLGPFTAEEQVPAEAMLDRAVEACLHWLDSPMEVAMAAVNAAVEPPAPA